MLDRHPDLYLFNETHWIPKLHESFGSEPAPTEEMLRVVDNTRHVTGKPTTFVSEDMRRELLEHRSYLTVRGFVDRLGGLIAAEANKSLWADKTPDYCVHIDLLGKLWPEARFIHLIRNGAAVALSMARHPGYQVLAAEHQLSWTSMAYGASNLWNTPRTSTLDAFLHLWCARIRHARDQANTLSRGRYLEIRYEELTQKPREILTEIASLVDLPDTEAWPELAGGLVDPERGKRAAWHAVTTKTDARAVELMKELGYGESLV